MKFFQKVFTTCAISSVLFMGMNSANALAVSDVSNNYWAVNAISDSVMHNYIPLKNDKFYPESPISRAEFANAVFNVIQRMPVSYADGFKDVNFQSRYGRSILTLQQLQIVCGYPDGKFRPDSNLKKSEASSIVANVVKSDFWDKSVLSPFKDKNDIPSWATPSYINNIINNIYINYPKSDYLMPNEYLTRAEAAVLMVKLREAVEEYKVSFMPDEIEVPNVNTTTTNKVVPIFVGTNTLAEFPYAYRKDVKLYDSKKVIVAGNLVPVKAMQRVDVRTVKENQPLIYVSPKDVYSVEGKKLYNQGTKFLANVDRTEKSYWLKKQHKAYIVFNRAVLTNGDEFPVAGVLYSTYKGKVVEEKAKHSLRVKNDANKKYSKRNAAWKFTNKLVPVIKYHDDTKDSLYMLITGDMIIPENSGL